MLNKMQRLTFFIAFYCLFMLPGLAMAQPTVFDKFEEVRKEQGAELLGAAERTVYSMNEKEGSVFALMLEDELKRRWAEANQLFLAYDFQQIMAKTFADGFEAANVENIPDYNVKRIVREVLDSGYVIEEKDGHFYPWLDYAYLLRVYKNNVSPEVKEYFELRLADSSVISTSKLSLSEIGERKLDLILQVEKYLRNYPDAYRKADVVALYKNKMSEYLVKLPDNAKVVNEGKISEAIFKNYRNANQNHPETMVGILAGEVAQAWEQQDMDYNSQMRNFLGSIDQQIDAFSTEHIKGIYFNNNGLHLFKPQGQKKYTILVGQVSPIDREQQQITNSGSNFLALDLKGIVAKTLPVDVDNVPYPETFTVERVLGINKWKLTDELFQADFIAFYGNPVWSLRILTNNEIIFETTTEQLPYRFSYSAPVVSNKNGKAIYTYNLQNSFGGKTNTLLVTISEQKVRDGILGIDYDYKASLNFNGHKYEGYAFKQSQKPANPDVLRSGN